MSFKRWFRLCGVLPIALIIASEDSPLNALESVFRRCAYVLVPISLLLIKYFPDLGVQYVTWSGTKMWIGVANQKNGLGVICTLSAIILIWGFLREWRAGFFAKGKANFVGNMLVLVMSLFLMRGFQGSYSATAIGILIVGILSLLLLYRVRNSGKRMANLLVVIAVSFLLCLTFSGALVPDVTSIFNRDSSFTGRSDIWSAVLDVASRKPVFGVGYGGYWGLQDEIIYGL